MCSKTKQCTLSVSYTHLDVYKRQDKDLLKRAVTNLVQNSITHNEQGCAIYVSVAEHDNNCIICVEDVGVGVSDEQIEKLNNTPHYMVCDLSLIHISAAFHGRTADLPNGIEKFFKKVLKNAKCARLQVADIFFFRFVVP